MDTTGNNQNNNTKTKTKNKALKSILSTIAIIIGIVLGLFTTATCVLFPSFCAITVLSNYGYLEHNRDVIMMKRTVDDILRNIINPTKTRKTNAVKTANYSSVVEKSLATIPTDAFKYNGHSYYIYNIDSVNYWNSAKAYCENVGGHLVTISSEEENQNVYSYMTSSGVESAYIGLNDVNSEGNWEWANGEPLTYTKWADGEPNGENSDEDYGMYYYQYSDGSWNDGDFGEETLNGGKKFICEWEPTANIPAEAIKYNGHSYMVYPTSVSWEDANSHCNSIGGHLATISDEMEQDFVANLTSKNTEKVNYWLGGHYSLTDNAWQWVDNSIWQYTNWDSWSNGTDTFNQPDNHSGNELYLRITNSDIQYETWTAHYGKWNDTSNEGDGNTGDASLNTFGFVCEWDN